MRREVLACFVVSLFVMQTWAISGSELSKVEISKTYQEDQQFNQSGFVQDDTYTTTDGENHVNRPSIQWSSPSQALAFGRSGACSVAVDSTDEVWLMGGRFDPDPSQTGDEEPTNMIERLDNGNKTWAPMGTNMPFRQQYCEAEIVGDLIFTVGDWYRGSSPTEYPSGRVQIYNLTNETWYNGTPMPSNQERGLGGMAEENGYLYYAGGVRNPSGTDATNKTFRYDPINDNWTRMADMNQPRASFELINFHGLLYAIGGFQGTQSWNRQALDYVESYDPTTDTWTNLTSLPVKMFGWGGTVLNDEIVLVGGYNGGLKKTVYHWNPVEDTWVNGIDIGTSGHFDLTVEEINGSIVWASGDVSSYAYSNWQQTFSTSTEYQNVSETHSGWITSPIMDLRPNVNGRAAPVQFDLQGNNTPGGVIGFQYRAASTSAALSTVSWIGSDSTSNTTFPLGITDIELEDYADFVQYRIKMTVTDLANWDEPELDSMAVHAEHAAFNSLLPTVLHPRGETVTIQTSHDAFSGEMYLELAPCDSNGALWSEWSRISYDGSTFSENDTMNIMLQSSGVVNSSSIDETLIDWSFDLGDLVLSNDNGTSEFNITDLCVKVGTSGEQDLEYIYTSTIRIDRILHVDITGIQDLSIGDATTGGYPIQIGINHTFPETGMTLSSGNIQARITFQTQILDPETNTNGGWINETTPWTELTIGQNDIIAWTLPSNVSGVVEMILESRSDQPFQMVSNSNSWNLILDNDNPVIMSSIPTIGSYIDSMENRELSLMIADTSGFISDEISLEVWVEGLDDGSDGSMPDGIPQEQEFREINHSLENEDSFWWINATQSDNENTDDQHVYLRVIAEDNVGISTINNTIWWTTRDAQNAVIESISRENEVQYWEVSRNISWDITLSDSNSIYDIISMRVELGDDSDFGVIYNAADNSCSSLDYRIDSDRTICSHVLDGENMVVSINLFSGWEVDLSVLDEGVVDLVIEDVDGTNSVTYQGLWLFSDDFDFSIYSVQDVTGSVTGDITGESIVIAGEIVQITGMVTHSLSGTPYQGDLSLTWWGLIQGNSWYGGSTVSVVNGEINASIPMPNTGGILDMSVAFMDPLETKTIGSLDLPVFDIDSQPPTILDSNPDGYSRYHLEDIGIGINVDENLAWTGELGITCQVISTDIDWEPITISQPPSNVFQSMTLFSFKFDFSGQGDPSLLSPEAHIDCWAAGFDDSGLELVSESGTSLLEPWITLPLSTVGPNIELVDVELVGEPEPGKDIRVEISVKNSGESLQDSFNITVYTIKGDERTLVGRFSQAKIASGQGVVKRVGVTVPTGDWTLEVFVDEDQKIWELNENDNSFSKNFEEPDEFSYSIIAGIGSGAGILLLLVFILRRRSGDDLSESKNPSLENLPRTGPPQSMRSDIKSSKPKKGPPPPKRKVENVPVDNPVPDITNAMAKLSLSTLPGNVEPQPEKVPSFESLPGGGDYEYLGEGTYYSGENIGRWKLEDDGSFTKQE